MSPSILDPSFALAVSVMGMGITMFLWGYEKVYGPKITKIGVIYAATGIIFVLLALLILLNYGHLLFFNNSVTENDNPTNLTSGNISYVLQASQPTSTDWTVIVGVVASFIGIVAIIVTYFIGFKTIQLQERIYKNQKIDVETSKTEHQKSILQSLKVEFDTISNDIYNIKIFGRNHETKGNLQWFKEVIREWRASRVNIDYPSHPIWSIKESIYLNDLENLVDGKNVTELKHAIVLINQHINTINSNINRIVSWAKTPVYTNESIASGLDYIEKTIDEMIKMIEECKDFLKREFSI